MYSAQRLVVDTSNVAGPSSTKIDRNLTPASARSNASNASNAIPRMRTGSNASTSSSLSITSPKSSSTNASSSSVNNIPQERSNEQEPEQDLVLAMHDYAPDNEHVTYLSFRAGEIISVLNRDNSGWWDGQIGSRRGWFPSNYVNSDSESLGEEKPLRTTRLHAHHRSTSSATSWGSGSYDRHSLVPLRRRPSLSVDADDANCPPLMIPLRHGLGLLQTAVQKNRPSHFQPSTACIISCVRTVLSTTDCLPREAPLLQRYPTLAQERKRILSVLASLVAQTKKASENMDNDENKEIEVEAMLRLSGQVFTHVRRFLAIAVQCGVDLPERDVNSSEEQPWSASTQQTPMPHDREKYSSPTTPQLPVTARTRSMSELRTPQPNVSENAYQYPVPKLPPNLAKSRNLSKDHNRHVQNTSISSSSSFSSIDSAGSPAKPVFPHGPSTTAQVMEALRYTHDQYLSTIAAFIGHAHSHSRSSHASSTGHMYDLVREIVEMVCKLLTIVEAVLRHPDVPAHKLGNLKAAKDGLYNVTSSLAESVRLLTVPQPVGITDEEEKQQLLRSATGALKAGADCVAAVKMCLYRSLGERPFIVYLPTVGEPGSEAFTPSKFSAGLNKTTSMGALHTQYYIDTAAADDDMTVQGQNLLRARPRDQSSGSENSSKQSGSVDTHGTTPEEHHKPLIPLTLLPQSPFDPELSSPTFPRTDDGTVWEGSMRGHTGGLSLEEKIFNGDLPIVPLEPITESADPTAWMLSNDYAADDVAYNGEGHLVGATLEVLVEKMTPHDSIVDSAFLAVFFMTFRLFSSPLELVAAIIARYHLRHPGNLSPADLAFWQQRKGIPVRLRVSNFIKLWVELYWRSGVDGNALDPLNNFTQTELKVMFPGPAQRIAELIEMRRQTSDLGVSPKGDRIRDPGMSINPPSAGLPPSEIPRPTMTKTLLAALRSRNFASIAIMDFDALELARQVTIMECNLYRAIQPEEVLETGQEGAKVPVNVRAVSTLSTIITGWVAESILNEQDTKKRTLLVKFFIKVADRCTSLHNYSTPRSILAALDSSTISRLHQTWIGLPQKYKSQLEVIRRLADHSRNYHEYRSKLRNTAPPAVPFLGLYLTDVTFCREGNPSHRASPLNSDKKLLNFNKYHKLARIVQDMQRFQVPYQLKAIPEVQDYLNVAFQGSKKHGDLQDLYRRSLLVEPKQAADRDAPPVSDVRQLFNWATRSQQPQALAQPAMAL